MLVRLPYNLACMEQRMSDYSREPVHDAAFRFRVNEALLAAAEVRARQDGMTLSELIRHALRREIREAA